MHTQGDCFDVKAPLSSVALEGADKGQRLSFYCSFLTLLKPRVMPPLLLACVRLRDFLLDQFLFFALSLSSQTFVLLARSDL